MDLHDYISTTYREVDLYSGVAAAKRWLQKGEAVVVSEDGQFRGVLSAMDLINRNHILVADCLTEKPFPDILYDPVELLSIMTINRWDYLPIQEKGTFTGVISQAALFNAILGMNATSEGSKAAELEKLLSVKDKLMLILGHDVRNLFQQVIGTLDILRHQYRELPQEKIDKLIKQSFESAVQVNSIFESMLTWSRANQGKLPYQPVAISVSEMFDTVLRQFNLAAEKKAVALKTEVDRSINIHADRLLLISILLNLVYNAIKFSRPGDFIVLKAAAKDGMVEISVGDTGVGMPKEKMEDLFNRPYSTQGTLEESGTGIGLILCKEFVELNGGVIWVESEPGSGTCVKFTVPESQVQAIAGR